MTKPIEVEEKPDRAGLGYDKPKLKGFEIGKKHEIDRTTVIPHHQDFEWLINSEPYSTMKWSLDWMKEGERSFEQYDWGLYCDRELVLKLFGTKSKLDELPEKNFFDARESANPYEKIGKHFFMNRAALKMANLDALFHLLPPAVC